MGFYMLIQTLYARSTPLRHKGGQESWEEALIMWVEEEKENTLSRLKTRSSSLQKQHRQCHLQKREPNCALSQMKWGFEFKTDSLCHDVVFSIGQCDSVTKLGEFTAVTI